MNVSCFRDDVDSPRVCSGSSEGADRDKGGVQKKIGEIETSRMTPSRDRKRSDDVVSDTPESPKPQPMAFTIDFNEGKTVDMTKYENLMKKSQARHQRVQSMSANWSRPSAGNSLQTRPPMSAKLPRKAHGYHSEGYFSSDQEDTVGTSKVRHLPTHDNKKQGHIYPTNFSPGVERESLRRNSKYDNHFSCSPAIDKHYDKSPDFHYSKKTKSPIVDGIMSKSDGLPSRQGLNLPIKYPYNTCLNRTNSEMINTPGYVNTLPDYTLRSPFFTEQSPSDVPMLADTSSPELELLTPGTPICVSSRRNSSSALRSFSPILVRSPSATRTGVIKTSIVKSPLNVEENVSPSSTVSEAGTYTIEANNYTEEQKAKMNIDEDFNTNEFQEPIREALDKFNSVDPKDKININKDYVITKEPSRSSNFACGIREELLLAKEIPDPIRKVSTDKNVLEISCCYESPTETHEPRQIAKPTKSAKSYLDKIKTRVKNISEKTFQKSSKSENSADFGSFTSVTASGVLGSGITVKNKGDDAQIRERLSRKNSLTTSQVDSSNYVHHLPRDHLVLQAVSNDSYMPADKEVSSHLSPEQIIVGKLSHISLNRCQGDKSWIQEWADSVKKHNKELCELSAPCPDIGLAALPPVSPRHSVLLKGTASPVRSPARSASSACSSPCKLPSPGVTIMRARPPIPDILSSTPDTESYLLSTQDVISNLQAKLQNAKASSNDARADFLAEKYPSKLPVSQLSRSNSLNYRLHRKNDSLESSPLRNPGKYFVTGTQAIHDDTRILLSSIGASKSLDTDRKYSLRYDRYDNHPPSPRDHSRHQNSRSNDFNNANMTRSLNVDSRERNYHIDEQKINNRNVVNSYRGGIDLTRDVSLLPGNNRVNGMRISHQRGNSDTLTRDSRNNKNVSNVLQSSPIRRSSSFNIVNKNNNVYEPATRVSSARNSSRLVKERMEMGRNNTPEVDYMSEDSDNLSTGGFYSDYDRRSLRRNECNDVLSGTRYNRAFALRRARLESPDLRCPGTPEMKRKFGNEVRQRAQSRDSRTPVRKSETRDIVVSDKAQRGRKMTETPRQSISNRMTRSSSTTKDLQQKPGEKAVKKVTTPTPITLTKEMELANWKKRSSYDPMKAVEEDRRRKASAGQPPAKLVVQEEQSYSKLSSPVHRSRSFNCVSAALGQAPPEPAETGSREDLDDKITPRVDTEAERLENSMNNPPDVTRLADWTKQNYSQNHFRPNPVAALQSRFKILTYQEQQTPPGLVPPQVSTDSPSNESWHESEERNPPPSDEDDEDKTGQVIPPHQRHSGDFSMSSSTTSASKEVRGLSKIQPRYMDISKYKPCEPAVKTFLRRDPSKTYVGVLPSAEHRSQAKRNSARQEQELKNKELEKWKRRASYDPRKAAAQAKGPKPATNKIPSSSRVLRSQSFHGPMTQPTKMSLGNFDPSSGQDASSDNEF